MATVAALEGRRLLGEGTGLLFVTVAVNQGGCCSWRETNLWAVLQRIASFKRWGDHARSDELIELAGPAKAVSSRPDKLGYSPPVGGYHDPLPGFDSPDVQAEVVLQFAYASFHGLIIATYSHNLKR